MHWKSEKIKCLRLKILFYCFFQVKAINNAITQCAQPCEETLYLRYMEEFISMLASLFCHISGSIRHRQLGCFFSNNSFPVSTCLQLSSECWLC